jgi:hypothetical protein
MYARTIGVAWLALTVGLGSGCDPVWENQVSVNVPVDVQAAFSPDRSGLVLLGDSILARLCGPTQAPLVSATIHGDVGCATEREVRAIAVRLTMEDISPLEDAQKRLVACGATTTVDERELGGDVLPRAKGWSSRPAVAEATGVVFAGKGHCGSGHGDPISLTLQLSAR